VNNSNSPAAAASYSAAPFLCESGPTGILLLHGYSGSPHEMRPMGQALQAAGYTVHAPLIAGHGGAPADLHGVRWQDWYASALEGLQLLQARRTTVFVCGFSAGGLLALHLAAHTDGAGLAGIITLAPALSLRGGQLLSLTGVLKHVVPWYYPLARADFANPGVRASILERAPEANLDDPAVVAEIKRSARVPVASLHELARLQATVRRDLHRVSIPVLVMQGRLDRTVEPGSAAEVFKRIRSPDRRLVWFEHSGHQLPNEGEREEVWRTAIEWLHRQVALRKASATSD
jgi:carboxylesterase